MGEEEKFEGWEESLKEYISQYIAETKERIPEIERKLFAIEKKEGDEAELVRELFRDWHTVKGAAGFLGLNKTVELSHKTENLIAKIRDEKIPVTEDIINVLFDALEKLKILTDNIALTGEEGDIEIDTEIKKIQKILEKLQGEIIPQTEEKKEEIREKEGVAGREDRKLEKEEKKQEKLKEIQIEQVRTKYAETKEGIIREDIIAAAKMKEEKEIKEDEEKKEEEKRRKKFAYETIRISTKKVDDVMALSEELILERNFLLNIFPKIEEKYPKDEDVIRASEIVANIDKIISMLRFSVMKMRMIPIKTIFAKFPGTVRNIAKQFGKKVELITEGEETELDRNIVDEIEEPLIHLIRNAIDHGIEKPEERIALGKPPEGKIILRAYYEGENVVIEVQDDGRGIDPEIIRKKAIEKGFITEEQANSMSEKEIINLIFLPGFSSKDVATEVSGRGVGMDVVKAKVVQLKGTLDIETEVGLGTKITMKLPLTVGIMNTLKVSCNGNQFFIPLSSVIEISRISKNEIKYASGQPVINWREYLLPAVYLGKVLGIGSNNLDMYHLIVVGVAEKKLGILVDSVISSEEVAVKTISGIKKATGIAGATISADGEPILVVDIYSILKFLEDGGIDSRRLI
ncbi:MAG: chemotaxis protein CheA [Candidatus Calescibacterium sp.]|jgi:two-component system chemotaxis sensor kinase CheA|nr:chemotaxis protein CheA [Candidatus Calescibacterium sp.]